LFGCHEAHRDGSFKIDLPPVNTLFDECEWMPFIRLTKLISDFI
jgi:hypothetical protein